MKYNNIDLIKKVYARLKSNSYLDQTLVIQAVEHENFHVMEFLMEYANTLEPKRKSLLVDSNFLLGFLHIAVKNGKLDSVPSIVRQLRLLSKNSSNSAAILFKLEHIKLFFDALSSCDKPTIEYFIKYFEGRRLECEKDFTACRDYDAYFKNIAKRVLESGDVESVILLANKYDEYKISNFHIVDAARECNNLDMRRFVEDFFHKHRKGNASMTCLNSLGLAIQAGQTFVVKHILQQREQQRDGDGEQEFIPNKEMLGNVARKNDPELLELLLGHKGRIAVFDPSSYFEDAVKSNHINMAKFLLNLGARPTNESLIRAIKQTRDIEMIMLLFNHVSFDVASDLLAAITDPEGRPDEETSTLSTNVFKCLSNTQNAFREFMRNDIGKAMESLHTAYFMSPTYFCKRMTSLVETMNEKSRPHFIGLILDTINQDVSLSETVMELPQETRLSRTEKTRVQIFSESMHRLLKSADQARLAPNKIRLG